MGIPGGEILCSLLNYYDEQEKNVRIQRIRELTNNDLMNISYFNNLLSTRRTIQYGSTTKTITASTTGDLRTRRRKEMEKKGQKDAANLFEALCINGIGGEGIIKISDYKKYTEDSDRT